MGRGSSKVLSQIDYVTTYLPLGLQDSCCDLVIDAASSKLAGLHLRWMCTVHTVYAIDYVPQLSHAKDTPY